MEAPFTPDDLERLRQRSAGADVRLRQVQQWIMSTLTIIVVWSFAIGLCFAAAALDTGRDKQIGVLVMAGIMGMMGFIGATAIHGRLKPHPIWLLGPVPALIAAWVILG